MIEQFANNPQTTLNGAINNSTTSVVVTSAASFPTVGQFRIIVGTEIMLVTSVSSNTFTATRGYEGSTAASHSDLAAVALVVTKGSLAAASVGTFGDDALGHTYYCDLQGTTTSSTSAELFVGGIASKRIAIPTDTAVLIEIVHLVGRSSNQPYRQFSTGYKGYYDNDGSSTTCMSSTTYVNNYTNDDLAQSISWGVSSNNATITINSNNSLHDYRWQAHVRVTQVKQHYTPGGS
jgi:hypothetical protein